MARTYMKIFSYLHLSNTIWMQFLQPSKDIVTQYATLICNFHAARFKFRAVKQHETETINTFYHQILYLAGQCQFENINEHLIDAIVYGCKSKKAHDKLLQMPIWMMLEECLHICRHYESF